MGAAGRACVAARFAAWPDGHEFRQGKTGLLDAAQKFHRWLFLHQHDVILPAKKLRQIFQVAHQLRLMLRGIERFALRDARLGQRVEDENIRRASPGLRIDIQLRDELRVEPRRAPAGNVQGDALGPLRRKRKFKLRGRKRPSRFHPDFSSGETISSRRRRGRFHRDKFSPAVPPWAGRRLARRWRR